MNRCLVLAAALALAPAFTAEAQVPQTLSYQGVLTDNLGNIVPNGSYTLMFRLYIAASGGPSIWDETHVGVPVTKGGFSVILGSINPLDRRFEQQFWLGLSVGGGPELSPRMQLTSSPYSLGLRLPFIGSISSTQPTIYLENFGGGPALGIFGWMQVGAPGTQGRLEWTQSGTSNKAGQLTSYYGLGGGVLTYDEGGQIMIGLEADNAGSGGYLYVDGGGSGFVAVDGNSDNAGSPTLSGYGAASYFSLNTSVSGDNAAVLSESSISAYEEMNEPGISQGRMTSIFWFPVSSTIQDVTTTTITIPTAGYIVVRAEGLLLLTCRDGGSRNFVYLQIDETPGGDVIWGGTMGGFSTSPRGDYYASATCRRTYYKEAGTYTFRLEGKADRANPLLDSGGIRDPLVMATFYPTAYGAVEEVPDIPEGASVAVAEGHPSRVVQPSVDLRELELRATRAEAAAQRAARDLVMAQLSQQQAAAAASQNPKKN